MMMKKFSVFLLAAALGLLPGVSMAHPEHDDEPVKAVGEMKAQLVASKTQATITVTKDGVAVATTGASGTLTLLDGDKKSALALKPAARNTLTAKSANPIRKGTRAQVVINFADKTSLSTELVAN